MVKELFQKYQKLVYAVLAAVLAYVLLAYVVPAFLSVKVVSLAGAVVIGYLVYTKVALWEIKKVFSKVTDTADKVVDQVKKI